MAKPSNSAPGSGVTRGSLLGTGDAILQDSHLLVYGLSWIGLLPYLRDSLITAV